MIAAALKKHAVPVASLKPDPRNARDHGKKNLDAIKSSLKRFGQQKPIVIRADKTVLAGNGTLAAAKALGWKEIAAVIFTGNKKDAAEFAIADNRSAELAEWNFTELNAQLQKSNGFDLGFNEKEIAAIFAKAQPGDLEVELPTKPTRSRLQHTCPSCGHKFSSTQK